MGIVGCYRDNRVKEVTCKRLLVSMCHALGFNASHFSQAVIATGLRDADRVR